MLQTTVNTTSNNTRNATPSKKAKKKTSMENVKLMNQFNASPIVKSVTSPSKHKSSHADFDNSNTLPVKKSNSSSTTTRSKKHRVRSAKISRGSQGQYLYNKERERREKIKKSRHKSANIIEHRKRMKKIWEQHHNLQRPPSRQRTPFPTHLAEFEFKRFQAFGKDNAVKNKVPTDPIAKSQIMRARKVAEESPRPPSRHRPPGESLFLNESENRTKQQEDNNNNNKKNSKKKNTGEGSNKDNSTAGDKTKILYVDDLIMSSKQSSSSNGEDDHVLNNNNNNSNVNINNSSNDDMVDDGDEANNGIKNDSNEDDEIEINISKAWKRHKNHQSNKSLHHKIKTKTPRSMSRNKNMTKSMSVLEFVTSDDGGRPRVVQMQNLYDLTMDPPKEHAIPIQITTRRKDGRHVTSTTNTFEVAEAARTRASSALGINKRNRDKAKPNGKIRPSSSRSKLMSSSHSRRKIQYHQQQQQQQQQQGKHPVSPLPLNALERQDDSKNNTERTMLRPQTPPRRPNSAHPSDKPEAVHEQPFTATDVTNAETVISLNTNTRSGTSSLGKTLKSRGRTPRKIIVKSSSSKKDLLPNNNIKNTKSNKIKVSRVQRMLSSNANAERARTATVVDNENKKGLDFGNYRPPLTASAPSNIDKQKKTSSPVLGGVAGNVIINSNNNKMKKTPSPPPKNNGNNISSGSTRVIQNNNFNIVTGKDTKLAKVLGDNEDGSNERRIIERGNKLAATTQGRPQSSRARGIQAERARSGQRRPKLYKNDNTTNGTNAYYIDPRAELEETNQELRRWENEMAKLRGEKPSMDDDDDDDGGDNWKENWKNDAERDFEAVFGKDTALLHDDDSDGSSIDSYEDDSIHSSVSSTFSHSSDDDGWGHVRRRPRRSANSTNYNSSNNKKHISKNDVGEKMNNNENDMIVDNDFDQHEYIHEDHDLDRDLDRDLDIVEKEQQQQQQQKQPMEQQPLEEFKNEFMLEEDEAVEEEDIDDTDGSLDSDAMMMMDENLNSTLGSEFLSLFA